VSSQSPRPVLGILHPGQMGAAVAAQAVRTGAEVLWCPDGRSEPTATRAREARLRAVTLQELLAESAVVLSICPPAAAEDVANLVAEHRFNGVYVEANAIAPGRYHDIQAALRQSGAEVIDGCLIGPPPRPGKAVQLYVAGPGEPVTRVQAFFTGTAVHTHRMETPPGSASALKMSYASYQKATRALAAVAHALADQHGVRDHLITEAERSARSPLADPGYLPNVAARAWRWAPEMHEIASTLDSAGLPPDLAKAASRVLQQWATDKDDTDLPLHAVFAHLQTSRGQPKGD